MITEGVFRLANDMTVTVNPTANTVRSLLVNAPFAILRGMGVLDPHDKWTFYVWRGDLMTHNDFYRQAEKSGLEIKDDIGVFFSTKEEIIEYEALSGSLLHGKIEDLAYGCYPAVEWARRILEENFPRLFRKVSEVSWAERSELVDDLKKFQGQGLFAHFAEVSKVGVNPGKGRNIATSHFDPYGVYAYSIDHMFANLDLIDNKLFGITRPLVYILKPVSPMIYINSDDFVALAKANGWAGNGKRGEKLWAKARMMFLKGERTWSSMLRGAEIIFDSEDVIQHAEPFQAVFLKPSSYRVVEVLNNSESRSPSTYSVGYWKKSIMEIFSSIAKKHKGSVYWKNQLPHVSARYQSIDFVVHMGEFSHIEVATSDFRHVVDIDLAAASKEEIEARIIETFDAIAGLVSSRRR